MRFARKWLKSAVCQAEERRLLAEERRQQSALMQNLLPDRVHSESCSCGLAPAPSPVKVVQAETPDRFKAEFDASLLQSNVINSQISSIDVQKLLAKT